MITRNLNSKVRYKEKTRGRGRQGRHEKGDSTECP